MPEKITFDHLISYADTGKYLEHIKGSDLFEISKIHLEGIIQASHFKKWEQGQDFSGIMIWFCLKQQNEFYLAFEGKSGFDYSKAVESGIENIVPDAQNLIKSSTVFGHDLSKESDLERFLKSHYHPVPAQDGSATRTEVEADIKLYLAHPTFSKHQKYGFAYFGNGNDNISAFLKQPGIEYIRYYLGFDPSLPVNNIRVILVPVGKDGKNLDFDNAQNEYQLLERSVPPPPHQ